MLWILTLGHVRSWWHVWYHMAAWSYALKLIWIELWKTEHRWLIWASSLWTKWWKHDATVEHLLRCFHCLEVSSAIFVNIWVCFFKEDLLIDDSLHMWHIRPWPLLHNLVFITTLEIQFGHAWHSSALYKWSLLKHQGSLLVLWVCRLWG